MMVNQEERKGRIFMYSILKYFYLRLISELERSRQLPTRASHICLSTGVLRQPQLEAAPDP